ncbi:hypothetical protein [Erythrobacter alti]|uniref:hypothetical protein n=1 Tax=Erythrobacter alti TaxID=1896145 RepID=UPI0030F43082
MAVNDPAQSNHPSVKHDIRWAGRWIVRGGYGVAVNAASMVYPNWRHRNDVSWLLMATMPNSGSTAIAKLLNHSTRIVELTNAGEGQWLHPAISAPGRRWDPDAKFDPDWLKRIWLSRVPAKPSPSVVFEKSPPNLCRMKAIYDALAPMERRVFCLTRDPLATCASWFTRYKLANLMLGWCPEKRGTVKTEGDHLRLLGELYGKRAGYLIGARDLAGFTLSYEEICAEPERFINELRNMFPILSDLDADAEIKVKDYEPMKLKNMNDRQISKLTPDQADAIREGLDEYRADVEELGYSF